MPVVVASVKRPDAVGMVQWFVTMFGKVGIEVVDPTPIPLASSCTKTPQMKWDQSHIVVPCPSVLCIIRSPISPQLSQEAIQMSSTRCALSIAAILAGSTSEAEAVRDGYEVEGDFATRRCSRTEGETKKRGRIR